MAPPDQAATRKPMHWAWLVLVPLLPLVVFCVICGPFLIQESIVRRLEERGVWIVYATPPAKWHQRWLRQVSRFQHFGMTLTEAKLTIEDAQTSQLLPQIMQDLRALPVRIHVDLSGSKQVHEDLQQLQSARVVAVSLRDHPIRAADARLLKALPDLKGLALTRCQLDRAAFQVIGELSGIEELYLEGTNIADADVPALLRLKDLWLISLSNTQVSDAAKEKLLEKFPNLDLTDD